MDGHPTPSRERTESRLLYDWVMARTQDEKILLGEAAEHLVLARLLRRMYLASQGPRGLAARHTRQWRLDCPGQGEQDRSQGWMVCRSSRATSLLFLCAVRLHDHGRASCLCAPE